MSKVVAASLAAVVVGTGATVTGAYMLGAFDTISALPPDLKSFKEANGGKNVGEYFSGVDLSSEGTAWGTNSKPEATFFDSGDDISSRLVINWEKHDCEGQSDKWTGSFRWLWMFRRGTRGFVMFTATKPSTEAKKIPLEGRLYLLDKGTSGWEVKYHKDLNGNKNISKDDFDNVFAAAGDGVKNSLSMETNKDNWGFVGAKTDLDNVCVHTDKNTHKPINTKAFRAVWNWSTEGGETGNLVKWSSKTETLLQQLYTKEQLDINAKLNTISGKWVKYTES